MYGYTGKGVTVSILDDGIQTTNPDIAHNYVREPEHLYRPVNLLLFESNLNYAMKQIILKQKFYYDTILRNT